MARFLLLAGRGSLNSQTSFRKEAVWAGVLSESCRRAHFTKSRSLSQWADMESMLQLHRPWHGDSVDSAVD